MTSVRPAGLDPQIVQVRVVTDQDRGDRLGLILPGLGVGGQDLLARAQGRDRHRLPRRQQDQRPRRERLPARRRTRPSAALTIAAVTADAAARAAPGTAAPGTAARVTAAGRRSRLLTAIRHAAGKRP
jgi:hypothetical protein